MTFEHPKLLLIDSYDSFTHNLASLFRSLLPTSSIHIIKNDDLNFSQLLSILPLFSAVVVGPGPGSPANPQDIGVVKDLWTLPDELLIPVFGVCLGLQSLAIECGAQLKRLDMAKHGQISKIYHTGTNLFYGVGDVHAVRYHSLHVDLSDARDIEPLAWTHDELPNGCVVMAIRHRCKPFWAVQYHPESVCTSGGGLEVIRNFWRLADNWATTNTRTVHPWCSSIKHIIGPSWPHLPPHSSPSSPSQSCPIVKTRILDLPGLDIALICDFLGASDESKLFALLESAAKPGRYSIIPCLTSSSFRILHYVGHNYVSVVTGNTTSLEVLGDHDVWSWIANFMQSRRARGHPEIPFWGGLVGTLSYELGVDSLQVPLRSSCSIPSPRHPDVNLVFVERSLVYDHEAGRLYVQSLLPNDDGWIETTCENLISMVHRRVPPEMHTKANIKMGATIMLPDKTLYLSRINQAKEHLFSGDSYELCLTAQTRITASSLSLANSSSWERYKLLRKDNPAPHSAYLRLHPSTFLSSSPERFLSFSRPPGSICQLRPIKGTVRKSPTITRAMAEKALAGSCKEVAENLMIVDLIRHDLHGVIGEDVQVTQFCKVEEYETVWQLVSVIEGKLPSNPAVDLNPDGEMGWEVLRRSLPPGSMTGAPKKRSVEILQTLEDTNRGLYSGVFGYWCVGGSGDWSVTIRSCFKHSECSPNMEDIQSDYPRCEEWFVGAGGAITALSDAEAEWDEMVVKLQSVLKAFGVRGAS